MIFHSAWEKDSFGLRSYGHTVATFLLMFIDVKGVLPMLQELFLQAPSYFVLLPLLHLFLIYRLAQARCNFFP